MKGIGNSTERMLVSEDYRGKPKSCILTVERILGHGNKNQDVYEPQYTLPTKITRKKS